MGLFARHQFPCGRTEQCCYGGASIQVGKHAIIFQNIRFGRPLATSLKTNCVRQNVGNRPPHECVIHFFFTIAALFPDPTSDRTEKTLFTPHRVPFPALEEGLDFVCSTKTRFFSPRGPTIFETSIKLFTWCGCGPAWFLRDRNW